MTDPTTSTTQSPGTGTAPPEAPGLMSPPPLRAPESAPLTDQHNQSSTSTPTPTAGRTTASINASQNSNNNVLDTTNNSAVFTADDFTNKQVLLLNKTKTTIWQIGGSCIIQGPGQPRFETRHQIHRGNQTLVITGTQLNMQILRYNDIVPPTEEFLQQWRTLFAFYLRIRAILLSDSPLLEIHDYRIHIQQLFNTKKLDSIQIENSFKKNNEMRNILLKAKTGPITKTTQFLYRSLDTAITFIENKLKQIRAENNRQSNVHSVNPLDIRLYPDPTAYDFFVEIPESVANFQTPIMIRNTRTPTPAVSSTNVNTDIRLAVREINELLTLANNETENINNNLLQDLLAEDMTLANQESHTDLNLNPHQGPPTHSEPNDNNTEPTPPPTQPTSDPPIRQSQDHQLADSPLDQIPIEQFYLCPLQTATTIDINLGDDWCTVFTLITDQIFEAIADNSQHREINLERAFKMYGGIPQIFFRTNDSDHPSTYLIKKRLMQYITGRQETLINSWTRDIQKFEMKRNKLSTADLNKKKSADADKLKMKAISLINSGFIRRGICQLESLGVAPINNPSIIQQMRNKHPQNIDVWEGQSTMDPTEFQIQNIIPLIKTLDPHKGTGPRSFKNDYLIKIVTSKKATDISKRAINNLVKLGQLYLSGTIPDKYRRLLSAGLLTPLIKKTDDSGHIEARPVKAEDADTSIFCRALSKSMTESIRSIVTPQQLAIGVDNGIQLYITGINLKLDEAARLNRPLSIVSLDVRNAHNEFNRKSMISELDQLILENPELKTLRCGLLSTIGIQPTIYMRDYKNPSGFLDLCNSCQGGGQGNALTNIAFPIAINRFLKSCESSHANIEVRAYQDNITIIGALEDIFTGENNAYQHLIDGIHRIGCRTNPDMFTIYCNEFDLQHNLIPPHFQRPNINIDDTIVYGVEICGTPIGHPEFRKNHIHAYAQDIISTIESTNHKISEISKHAALIATNLSFQNRFDYISDINLPSETYTARALIDLSLKHLYNHNLGCTVFEADNRQRDPNFVADRAQLRLNDSGIGYRPLQSRFNFINMMNRIIPNIPDIRDGEEILTKGSWPSLASVTGNIFNEDNRWQHFFDKNQHHTRELKDEWIRIQTIKQSLINGLDQEVRTDFNDIDCDVNIFGKNVRNLSRKISDIFNKLRVDSLNKRALLLHRDDPRRIAYFNVKDDDFATSIFCTSNTTFNTSNEIFQEISASHLGLPSPACTNFVGHQLPGAQNDEILDAFGYKLKSLTSVRGDSTRTLHNMILDLLFKELTNVKIWNRGSAPNTCKDIFVHHINHNVEDNDQRNIQGMIPDIQYNINQDMDVSSTLGDVKTFSPCIEYINSYGNRKPVDIRADRVQTEYLNKAKSLDIRYNNVQEGMQGPVETHLRSFNNGVVDGLVVGPFGECSNQIHKLRDIIVSRKVNYYAHHLDIDTAQITSKVKKAMCKSWGLYFASAWARLLLERLQLFYARARQIPNDLELPPEESNMAFNLLFV